MSRALADRLNDSLPLLTAQRRTSTARHQTMRAVIDWSYGLLSEDVQRFFRALGIFAGSFTAEAAATVAMDAATTSIDAIDRLADLVAKSLVVADVGGTKPRFRLLDTTRAYAIEKLDESGERERIARRHAEYYRDLFERAEGEVPVRPTSGWLADYAREIDNVRAALDWAFSPAAMQSIGVALTAAAVPLWMQLSLLERMPQPRRSRRLRARMARSRQRARTRDEAAGRAGRIAVRGAGRSTRPCTATRFDTREALGDTEHQLRALWGLWIHYHVATGDHRAALPCRAQRFHAPRANACRPATTCRSAIG